MTLKDTPEFTEYMRERRAKAKADAQNAKKELQKQKQKEYYQRNKLQIKEQKRIERHGKSPPKEFLYIGEDKDNK